MVAGLSFVLVLGVLCATFPTTVMGTHLRVNFSVDQDGGLWPWQLSDAVDQVRQIWHPAGVSVTWGRYGESAAPESTTVSLRILGGVHTRPDGTPILGWVNHAPEGGTIPMLFMSLGSINQFLSTGRLRGAPLTQRPLAFREKLTARAVGRIMAHELGHYLVAGKSHAKRGLLRPHYSPDDLTAPWLARFEVQSADRLAIQREVARLAQLQRTASSAGRDSQ